MIYNLLLTAKSSLPVLRKLGALKEGRDIIRNENSLNMIKVWLALEVRQFIHASVSDVCISDIKISESILTILDQCFGQVRHVKSKCIDEYDNDYLPQ